MFTFVRYASRILHINTIILQLATLFGRLLGVRYRISVEKIMETNGVVLCKSDEYSQYDTGNIENKKNSLRKRAHTWCTESLGGAWACLSEGDIQIRQLRYV